MFAVCFIAAPSIPEEPAVDDQPKQDSENGKYFIVTIIKVDMDFSYLIIKNSNCISNEYQVVFYLFLTKSRFQAK